MLPVHQSDRHRDRQGVGVFQRHGALQADHIPGQGNMVVSGRHGLLHHPEGCLVLTAKSHLGMVVEHQFVRRAGPPDGIDAAPDALFRQFPGPVIRIRTQRPVLQADQAFRDGQDGDIRVQMRQDGLQEPVDAEGRHAPDDEIDAGDGLLPFLELIIPDPFGERDIELGMKPALAAMVDDVPVQRRAHQTDVVPVLPGGESERRAHHTRADDGDTPHTSARMRASRSPGSRSMTGISIIV